MPIEFKTAGLNDFYFEFPATIKMDSAALKAGLRTLNFRRGFRAVLLRPTSQPARIGASPKVLNVLFYDSSVGTWIDLLKVFDTDAMIDSAQTSVAQFTMVDTTDFLYVQVARKILGIRLDLDGTIKNNNNQALQLAYSSAFGFTDHTSSVTDGTDSTGMFAQDGNVTLDTAPAAGLWQSDPLSKFVDTTNTPITERGFWIRIGAAGTIDAVEIEQMGTIPEDFPATLNLKGSAGAFIVDTEYNFNLDDSDIGGLAFLSRNATTDGTLDITFIRHS